MALAVLLLCPLAMVEAAVCHGRWAQLLLLAMATRAPEHNTGGSWERREPTPAAGGAARAYIGGHGLAGSCVREKTAVT